MTEVTITVSGPVGCAKSALLGEIEIMLKAMGVPVRYADEAAALAEKNGTHADWTDAIEMYKPSVVLVEKIERQAQLEARADVEVGMARAGKILDVVLNLAKTSCTVSLSESQERIDCVARALTDILNISTESAILPTPTTEGAQHAAVADARLHQERINFDTPLFRDLLRHSVGRQVRKEVKASFIDMIMMYLNLVQGKYPIPPGARFDWLNMHFLEVKSREGGSQS